MNLMDSDIVFLYFTFRYKKKYELPFPGKEKQGLE